jgi:protein CpxP
MKKLFLASTFLISVLGFSQTSNEGSKKSVVEKQTELNVKRLTLELDLTPAQQEKIKPLIAAEMEQKDLKRVSFINKKEQGIVVSEDEKHDLRMKLLDDEIAKKAKMKEILTADQYAKWEKNIADRRSNIQEKREGKKEQRAEKKEKRNSNK